MTEILIKRLSKRRLYLNMKQMGSSGLDLAANIDKKIEIKTR